MIVLQTKCTKNDGCRLKGSLKKQHQPWTTELQKHSQFTVTVIQKMQRGIDHAEVQKNRQ